MQAKLHINIPEGVIDIEGTPELVREVYADLKSILLNSKDYSPKKASKGAAETNIAKPGKVKRSVAPRKRTPVKQDGTGIDARSPKLDKSLDTSRLGTFYNQFEPKNHPEKILIFLKFLVEELGIESPNTDQVYTCYQAANERVPKAFSQAFRDASGRNFGYIDYNSPTELLVTTAGSNHFRFDLKKKAAE